jgi:hypothetical protein
VQKKLSRKLSLNRETIRQLTPREIGDAEGGATTILTTRSTPTDTCESCFAYCNSVNTAC